jgi:lipoyl(octanoyl) transferase
VPHDSDWTYSFVVPPNHKWFSLKAVESYRRIHEWIQNAFAKLKIETELAKAESGKRKAESAGCFIGHEKFDLLWRGKKIAGAAQRRNKLGLLIQGSIQPPVKIARADFEDAMCDAARENWEIKWNKFSPDLKLDARAGEFALQKYSRNNYNQKR